MYLIKSYITVIKTLIMIVFSILCYTASADVFKCTNNNGSIIYQEAPCSENKGEKMEIKSDYFRPDTGLREPELKMLEALKEAEVKVQTNTRKEVKKCQRLGFTYRPQDFRTVMPCSGIIFEDMVIKGTIISTAFAKRRSPE